MAKRPRLLSSTMTATTYIVTRYSEDSGHIVAHEKYEVEPRDLLDAVFALGVSQATMDEVAEKLGFTRKGSGDE